MESKRLVAILHLHTQFLARGIVSLTAKDLPAQVTFKAQIRVFLDVIRRTRCTADAMIDPEFLLMETASDQQQRRQKKRKAGFMINIIPLSEGERVSLLYRDG